MKKHFVFTMIALATSFIGSQAYAGTPIGHLDAINPATAGWACTSGESTTSTFVQVYLDVNGVGTHIITLPAIRPSEKAVADACGVPYGALGTKAYRFAIALKDLTAAIKARGVKTGTYSMYVYAVNMSGAYSLLANSVGQKIYVP